LALSRVWHRPGPWRGGLSRCVGRHRARRGAYLEVRRWTAQRAGIPGRDPIDDVCNPTHCLPSPGGPPGFRSWPRGHPVRLAAEGRRRRSAWPTVRSSTRSLDGGTLKSSPADCRGRRALGASSARERYLCAVFYVWSASTTGNITSTVRWAARVPGSTCAHSAVERRRRTTRVETQASRGCSEPPVRQPAVSMRLM